MNKQLPFRISALVFVRNFQGEHLLIHRNNKPNLGCWTPIGGKLDMMIGESPYECARRETEEEIQLQLSDKDLRCFGYISERNYENTAHWLMFLFDCKKKLSKLPKTIDEGQFKFFERSAVNALPIPETDRKLLWPYYDRYFDGFIGLRADCNPEDTLQIVEELSIKPPPRSD